MPVTRMSRTRSGRKTKKIDYSQMLEGTMDSDDSDDSHRLPTPPPKKKRKVAKKDSDDDFEYGGDLDELSASEPEEIERPTRTRRRTYKKKQKQEVDFETEEESYESEEFRPAAAVAKSKKSPLSIRAARKSVPKRKVIQPPPLENIQIKRPAKDKKKKAATIVSENSKIGSVSKAINLMPSDSEEIKCPNWYSSWNEDQKNLFKTLIGDSSRSTVKLEDLLIDECAIDRRNSREILRWWFRGMPRKRKKNSSPGLRPKKKRKISRKPSLPCSSLPEGNWTELAYVHRNEDIVEEEIEEVKEICLGTCESKVVGVRYYNGIVSNREAVVLEREPQNNYDKNAVRVLNLMGDQVGHINKYDAAKLAPLMDALKDENFKVEAMIPTGSKNIYEMPVNITFMGDPQLLDHVKASQVTYMSRFSRSGARFQPNGNNKVLGKTWKKVLSERDMLEGDTNQLFNSFIPYEKMPGIRSVEGLRVNLYEHQQKALWWMLKKEKVTTISEALADQDNGGTKGKKKVKNSSAFGWKKGRARGGRPVYINTATNFTTQEDFTLPNGGMLCDDMGLGKTITTLALIQHQKNYGANGPTLIVMPLSVLRQWEDAIETKTDLTVIKYHGSNREKNASKLEKYDVVLTTYSLVGNECGGKPKFGKKAKKHKPLGKIDWLRVVLDESHFIKNKKTNMAKGVCALKAESRWCLTGTPLQNKVDDIYSQVKFLKIQPFEDESWWKRLVLRPIKAQEKVGFERLQNLFSSVCLRRDKNMKVKGRDGKTRALIDLPECYQQVLKVPLNLKERKTYEKWYARGQSITQQGTSRDKSVDFASILHVILRARQSCCHNSLLPDEGDPTKDMDQDLVKKLILVLQNTGEEECPICLESLNELPAVITACAHLFCKGCIENHINANKPNCPMCRREVSIDTLVEPEDLEEGGEISSAGSSAKIAKLLEYIGSTKGDEKIVVFSQFTKFLDLMQSSLHEADIETSRLDGRMSYNQRIAAIREFEQDEEGSKVFLVSLKAGGVGLNLTRANHVVLMDPWWNPATEDQAVDRVFRIGQTRRVFVVRMIAENTVEEKILKLHARKRNLAKTLLGRSKKELQDLRTQEMIGLFTDDLQSSSF